MQIDFDHIVFQKKNLHADDRQINIPCYMLTSAGKELYKFVEVQPNMDYSSALANFLDGENAKLEYTAIVGRYGDELKIQPPWIQVKPQS